MRVRVISKTIQEFRGERFYLCGPYFQRKGRRLHREVWEAHNGPIPDGYHVHHSTGDRSRNQIEDLELVEASRHLSMHGSEPERVEASRMNIEAAREAASEWHGSEEGREWHREHYEENIRPLFEETVTKECEHCGEPYETTKPTAGNAMYCSNRCKAAARRESGVDDEERTCEVCAETFTVNKYYETRTCSRSCGRRLALASSG